MQRASVRSTVLADNVHASQMEMPCGLQHVTVVCRDFIDADSTWSCVPPGAPSMACVPSPGATPPEANPYGDQQRRNQNVSVGRGTEQRILQITEHGAGILRHASRDTNGART